MQETQRKLNHAPLQRLNEINSTLPSQKCLQFEGEVNHDNFEVSFDYSFLAPPIEDLPGYALQPIGLNDSVVSAVSALPAFEVFYLTG